jgi:hypothetical protein
MLSQLIYASKALVKVDYPLLEQLNEPRRGQRDV